MTYPLIVKERNPNNKGETMKLKAHNVTSQNGRETLRFVVWSRQGSGMVNIFAVGSSQGSCEMKSLEAAREYYLRCVNDWGYVPAPSTTFEPC